ncbi:MAG TPA: Flp family type IVb pilin [Firmicutes bacterium]|nr:Flp family type IVb pilin [Bacillota bacterium]
MSLLAQLKQLLLDDSGQGMVEYGLILALIAILVIGALKLLGEGVSGIFGRITEEVGGTSD